MNTCQLVKFKTKSWKIPQNLPRRVVISGTTGYLGGALCAVLLRSGVKVVALNRRSAELFRDQGNYDEVLLGDTSVESLTDQLSSRSPEAIVHPAAMTSAAQCEADPEAAQAANPGLTGTIIELAERCQSYLISLSTDLVYDGYTTAPAGGFSEDDPVKPASVYSKTKQQAEKLVLSSPVEGLVLRASLIYGPYLPFCRMPLDWLVEGLRADGVTLFEDEWRTPVYIGDLVGSIADLLVLRPQGVLHCAGSQRLSRVELGEAFAAALGIANPPITRRSLKEIEFSPPRPADVSLNNSKLLGMTGRQFTPLLKALEFLGQIKTS